MAIPENLTPEQFCDVISSSLVQDGNFIRAIRPHYAGLSQAARDGVKVALANTLTAEKTKIDDIIAYINALP